MTDIVERLRDRNAVVLGGLFHAIPTMREAAEEIEWLRDVLRSCVHGMEVVELADGEFLGLHLPNKPVTSGDREGKS